MKIDRLVAILAILLREEQTTAPKLAAQLEVSRRTVNRDLENLAKVGVPIVTRQGSGGGISLAEDYKLEKGLLKRQELRAVLMGGGQPTAMQSGGPSQLPVKLAAAAAGPAASESVFIDPAAHDLGSLPEKVQLLQDAIARQVCVAFDYYAEQGRQRRRVEPHYIVYQGADWYLYAYCLSREDFRLFQLNRLWRLELLAEPTQPREAADQAPKADFPPRRAEQEVTVLFEPSVAHLLVEAYGPESYAETAEGRLLFRHTYADTDEMLRWLLSFGAQAEIIAPPELLRKMRVQVKRMSAKYLN